jgi:hypothetical protein
MVKTIESSRKKSPPCARNRFGEPNINGCGTKKELLRFIFPFLALFQISTSLVFASKPYPGSTFIREIKWHKLTHISGAEGSDLFQTTWAADGNIYTAWGDGKGFGAYSKRSFGVSVLNGYPPVIQGVDFHYGPYGSDNGKIVDLLDVNGIIFATFNTQDGSWPDAS